MREFTTIVVKILFLLGGYGDKFQILVFIIYNFNFSTPDLVIQVGILITRLLKASLEGRLFTRYDETQTRMTWWLVIVQLNSGQITSGSIGLVSYLQKY